ncbi:hypothetical protein EB001_27555 [bacterium]|nr:hypothetical protein [bacterium]
MPLLEAIRLADLDDGTCNGRIALPKDGLGTLQKHVDNPHDRLREAREKEIAGRFHTVGRGSEYQSEPVGVVGVATETLHTVDVD